MFDTGTLDALALDTELTKERVRQITKRAAKTMGELVAGSSKFQVMAEYKAAAAGKATTRSATGNVVAIGAAVQSVEAEWEDARQAA